MAVTRSCDQRGVALLTVLLLVAVMSVLVMALLDDVRFSVRRAGNAQALSQAQWQALGAESLARVQLARLAARDPARTTLAGGWNNRPLVFPVEGGVLRARLGDGTACFNLNAVVAGAGDYLVRHDAGVAQYRALLSRLDVDERRAVQLADVLVDWLDSDPATSPVGAEDDAYALGAGGYLTGNTLLAEPSELRALRGYDTATYSLLRPHVCALPIAGATPINVNTLGGDDWRLVSMLADGALGPDEARAVIASRPADGWREIAAFTAQPAFADHPVSADALANLSLRSRYFRLRVETEHGDAQAVLDTLIEQDAGGGTRPVARRWTRDE